MDLFFPKRFDVARFRRFLFLALFASIALSACGSKGEDTRPADVAPSGPSAPAPSVSLQANPAAIASGQTSSLTWTVSNATQCTATGDWSGAKSVSGGSQQVGPLSASKIYNLQCSGAGGSASASATVTVSGSPPPTPAPTVSLQAAPTQVASGGSSTLSWTVANASQCTASGGWSGAKSAAGGSQSVGPLTSSQSFSLNCTGAGGAANASATVTVQSAPPPAPPPIGSTLTTLTIKDLGGSGGSNVPVTFGQVFKPGDVPANAYLAARTAGGGSVAVPLQTDVKARHADGSLRHAVLTARVPNLAASGSAGVELVSSASAPAAGSLSVSDLINAGFDAVVDLDVGGVGYRVSAASLLPAAANNTWLKGALATEWMLASAALPTAGGSPHPHLSVRFNVRAYAGLDAVRVDVIVENNWAYEPSPRNIAYTATVTIGGASVFDQSITHNHHARWRKTYWWRAPASVHVAHDKAYLFATGALPNYDQTLVVRESGSGYTLNSLDSEWRNANTAPMGAGLVNTYMPGGGARPDLGPMPRWSAMYLLSMHEKAKAPTLGVGDLAGSWPIHYRDKNTDLPVTLSNYPYMTLLGSASDTRNPATGQYEAFPSCGGSCSTSYSPDSSHQPSLAYVPYLVSGDHYYLEELHFWANWNVFQSNPYYREFGQGLLKWDQVRGQAWSLRTLGHAAYITPDGHALKSYFAALLNNNLAWYNQNAVNSNALGVLTAGGAIVYNDPTGVERGVAPWQDDFFTWSAGHVAALGYSDANALVGWKAKFPIGRMTDPGFCWVLSSAYRIFVRPGGSGALHSTFAQVYNDLVNTDYPALNGRACGSQDMGNALGLAAGEMVGYSSDPTGYPSNQQPALAVAVDAGATNAAAAWSAFMNRTVKPDYAGYPNYAIVPR